MLNLITPFHVTNHVVLQKHSKNTPEAALHDNLVTGYIVPHSSIIIFSSCHRSYTTLLSRSKVNFTPPIANINPTTLDTAFRYSVDSWIVNPIHSNVRMGDKDPCF